MAYPNIPIIDITDAPSNEIAQQVLHAASTFGFLYIKNERLIPQKDIDDMFALSRQFFESPREQKAQYSIHSQRSGGKNRGWVSLKTESLDPSDQGDPKEAFNIAEPTTQPPQPLPPPLCGSATLLTRFQNQCHSLCQTILTLLAVALDIPEIEGGKRWFADRHDQAKGTSGTIFRLLYYPPSPPTHAAPPILAGSHSDYGSITLLFRAPPSSPSSPSPTLQILPPGSLEWSPVPINPFPDVLSNPPVLVNIGDLLSFWTRGLLRSTVHRVIGNPEGTNDPRYSMAYFCHPVDSVLLESVPAKKVQEQEGQGNGMMTEMKKVGVERSEGQVLTAKQHLDRRLNITYGLHD